MLIAIFIVAWRAPYVNAADIVSIMVEVVSVPAAVALAFLAIGARSSLRTKQSLVAQIYTRAVTHLNDGHDILAPNGFSDRTSVIALDVDPIDGTVMIQERPISGACRRYSISSDGLTVRRTVIEVGADGISNADRTWVQERLTPRRLKILFEALSKSELYVPRRSYIAV